MHGSVANNKYSPIELRRNISGSTSRLSKLAPVQTVGKNQGRRFAFKNTAGRRRDREELILISGRCFSFRALTILEWIVWNRQNPWRKHIGKLVLSFLYTIIIVVYIATLKMLVSPAGMHSHSGLSLCHLLGGRFMRLIEFKKSYQQIMKKRKELNWYVNISIASTYSFISCSNGITDCLNL